MLENIKNYKNTSIDWTKSQGEIIKLLESRGIKETRFTNLSFETMKGSGIDMEENTCAVMLEFMKPIQLDGCVGGTLPIKIIIPNIPNDEKLKRQAYRIFWHYLKNKFIGIDAGLIEFEQEFMPHIAIGKGSGVGTMWQEFKNKMLPQIVSGEKSDIKLLE